jgi:hypothetical protein
MREDDAKTTTQAGTVVGASRFAPVRFFSRRPHSQRYDYYSQTAAAVHPDGPSELNRQP